MSKAEPFDAEALKPCPFCGADVKMDERLDESLHSHNIVTFYSVGCGSCWACPSVQIEDREEVIKEWNSRPGETAAYSRGRADMASECVRDYAK